MVDLATKLRDLPFQVRIGEAVIPEHFKGSFAEGMAYAYGEAAKMVAADPLYKASREMATLLDQLLGLPWAPDGWNYKDDRAKNGKRTDRTDRLEWGVFMARVTKILATLPKEPEGSR